MNWKKISERVFFFILLVGLFFGGWQMISQYFKQQIIEQQESYLSKKGQLLIQQLTIDDLSSKHNQSVLTDFVHQSNERLTLLAPMVQSYSIRPITHYEGSEILVQKSKQSLMAAH